MREIKFRAWMNPNKVMLSHEELMSIPVTYHDVFEGNSKYPCMQYTGLKDKNGLEIYEGDIVKSICVVDLNTTEEYIGFVEYPKDDCGFYLIVKKITSKNGTRNSNYYTALKHHTNEIIGNIYENPELLEAQNGTL